MCPDHPADDPGTSESEATVLSYGLTSKYPVISRWSAEQNSVQ
jgi:hypothetical protein